MQQLKRPNYKPASHHKKIGKIKSENSSFKPIIIALVLMIVISGAFYFKKIDKEKKELQDKLSQSNEKKTDSELQVPLISPKDASNKIRHDAFQLIDIREKDEFVLKHIEASVNIPLSQLEDKINLLSKEKTIILIDRENSGNGRVLTQHLNEEGLDVKYLEGGILNYANSGYNLVNIGNPLIQSDLLKVTSYSAQELIDQLLEGARIKFVDTRPKVDYAIDHLEGSINIPLEELEKKKDKLPFRTFVVFDQDPIRSFQAAARLYDMNVIGVYNCKDTYQDLKDVIDNLGTEDNETQPAEEAVEQSEG